MTFQAVQRLFQQFPRQGRHGHRRWRKDQKQQGPFVKQGQVGDTEKFPERLEHKEVVEINAIADLADILQRAQR